MRDAVSRRFPGHGVLGEESGRSGPPDAPTWLVDPLDGTLNFAHGYPHFATALALVEGGEALVAATYDPIRDELFAAARGLGATRNGAPIRVSGTASLPDSLWVTSFPHQPRPHPDDNVSRFLAMNRATQAVRRDGCSSLDLAYVSAGRYDGYWQGGIFPWDQAGGVLLVREAGGRVTDLAGGPWRLDGREVLATNGVLHETAVAALAAASGARARGGADRGDPR